MTFEDCRIIISKFAAIIKEPHEVIKKHKGLRNSHEWRDFERAYLFLTGEKFKETGCGKCIQSAIQKANNISQTKFNNIMEKRQQKYKLKVNAKGKALIQFGGGHYNQDTMTDEIAFKMVAFSRKTAGYFSNGAELLADYDAAFKTELPAIEDAEVAPADITPADTGVTFEMRANHEPEKTAAKESKPEVKKSEHGKAEPKNKGGHPKGK